MESDKHGKSPKLSRFFSKSESAAERPGSEEPVFGVDLEVAVERSKCHDGLQLPLIVRECIDFVEENGLDCEGIYRLSAVKSKVQFLKERYDICEAVELDDQDPHTVACLLKLFLRELPEPLLTSSLVTQFEAAAALKQAEQRVQQLKALLDQLPAANRLLLQYLFKHMQHVIEQEKVNKMNVQNISLVLSATLQFSHRLLRAFFMYGKIFFDTVVIKKYVPPLSTSVLPDNAESILEEIGKLESFLIHLHHKIESGKCPQGREDQLWEAQRILTQLKRKQKSLMLKQSGDQSRVSLRNEAPGYDIQAETALPCSVITEDPSYNVIERRTRTVHMINEDNVTVIEIGQHRPTQTTHTPTAAPDGIDFVRTAISVSDSDIDAHSLSREAVILKLEEQLLLSTEKELRDKSVSELEEIGILKERIRDIETHNDSRIPSGVTDDAFVKSSTVDQDEDDFSLLSSILERNAELEACNAELQGSIEKEWYMCQRLHAQIQYLELEAIHVTQ